MPLNRTRRARAHRCGCTSTPAPPAGQAWPEGKAGLRERGELRIIGRPGDAITKLRALQEAGIEEVSLLIAGGSLDQLDLIASEVMPAFA